MSLFEVEPSIPLNEKAAQTLDATFTQKPVSLTLPVNAEPTSRIIIVKEKQDNTGLLVGLLAFFGLCTVAIVYLASKRHD